MAKARRAAFVVIGRTAALGLAAAIILTATSAEADPCRAPLPRQGSSVAGDVRYVGDGDSLCVGAGPDPASWIEVRLADFYAPELHEDGGPAAREALIRLAGGRRLVCVAQHRSYDRIVALCTLRGRPLGDLLRRAGDPEGGNGYRR
jgi:endonuclease YncB( thermonuclease family)